MPNESAKIILAVTNGKLLKVRDALAVEGTINALKVEFQFRTQDWDDTTKMAVFVRGRAIPSTTNADITYVMLDENNECDVPAEILEKDGMFSVGVFGESENYRIVSNWMCYKIADGCYADGSTPVDPGSSAYNQLIKMIKSKSDIGHNHAELYYTKDESEDRFVSQEEINNLVAAPDWNQNDESANDYIKNRTHYVKDPVIYEVLNYTNDAPSINNSNGICRIALQKCSFSEIEVGMTYSVTINDIAYETVATTTNKIGNNSLGNFGEDSGEIFLIQRISPTLALLYLNISEPPTYISLRITTQIQEVVQLDEKFISYKPGLKVNKGDIYSVLQEDGTYINISSDGNGEIFNDGCVAPGLNAHAQNTRTTAIGDGSHSEGFETVSKGLHSHTEGELTYAASDNQHVQGKFNIIDTENKYIHIDGNGNYNGSWTDGRSNAHTLDWSGNAWFAGSIKIGGTGQDDSDAKEIATKEYIDNVVNEEELNAMLEEVLV